MVSLEFVRRSRGSVLLVFLLLPTRFLLASSQLCVCVCVCVRVCVRECYLLLPSCARVCVCVCVCFCLSIFSSLVVSLLRLPS